jgi:hypothetical protein
MERTMAFSGDARHSRRNINSSHDTLAIVAFCIGFWALVMLAAGAF